MGLEIERKYLVKKFPKALLTTGVRMRQAYLTKPGEGISLRVRIAEENAWMTIKAGTTSRYARQEFEYKIPIEDAMAMIRDLPCYGQVEKTRFKVAHGEHMMEIDVYGGENHGLVMGEIEIENEHAKITPFPSNWDLQEVSPETYSNQKLAIAPFALWKKKPKCQLTSNSM